MSSFEGPSTPGSARLEMPRRGRAVEKRSAESGEEPRPLHIGEARESKLGGCSKNPGVPL